MAMISVRVSNDIPIQSEYLPLISLYFVFGILYTFISFNWFIVANVYRTGNYLPKYLKIFAKIIKYFHEKMTKKKANQIELTQENKVETDGLINLLNYFAFSCLFLAMFVSYLTIWIKIST